MPVKLPMQYCEFCRERIINDEDLQVDYGVRWRLKNPLRRRSYLARQRKKKYANGRTVGVICASCKKPLPANAKCNQRYCQDCAHKRRNKQALDAYHAKKAASPKGVKKPDPVAGERRCVACGSPLSPRTRLDACGLCRQRRYSRDSRRRSRGTVVCLCTKCGQETGHAQKLMCDTCKTEENKRKCLDCGGDFLAYKRTMRCERCREEHKQIAHQRYLRQHRVRKRIEKGQIVCFWCEQEIDLSRRRHRAKDDVPRFCSRACAVADRAETGFYKEMSRRGNQKQQEIERTTGSRPGTEARRAHVARLREDGKLKNYRKRQA